MCESVGDLTSGYLYIYIYTDKLLASGYHSVFSDKKEAMAAKMKPETRARLAPER